MLGNRLLFIYLLAPKIFGAHIPQMARDSADFKRYIGHKLKSPIAIEHLPYHPVDHRIKHEILAKHANATIAREINDVVHRQQHEKNRTHQEVQDEIEQVLEKQAHKENVAKGIQDVIEQDGLRKKQVAEEIELALHKKGSGHDATHQHAATHHQGHGHGKREGQHGQHTGHHHNHQGQSHHLSNDVYGDATHHHHDERHDHEHHSVHHHQGRDHQTYSSEIRSHSDYRKYDPRPYPAHHGVVLQKREDADENVVHVYITDYVTKTIVPKVTITEHITSTIFVEASKIPETQTSDIVQSEVTSEETPTIVSEGIQTVFVTVTNTVVVEASPVVLTEENSVPETESSPTEDSGDPTQSFATAERVDSTVLANSTITITLENTVTFTKTAFATVTQTIYVVTEEVKREFNLDHDSRSKESKASVPDISDENDQAETLTSGLLLPPTTTTASDVPHETLENEDTITSKSSESVSNSGVPEQQDERTVIHNVEGLLKDFGHREGTVATGNPNKNALSDVETQLNSFKSSSQTSVQADENLTMEQKFHAACNFPYGSDEFWDCHDRFFGNHGHKKKPHHKHHEYMPDAVRYRKKRFHEIESEPDLERRLLRFKKSRRE